MIYSVINKTSGLSVYEYQADTPIEWEGMEFSTHDHVEVSAPVHIEDRPTKFGGRRILTKLEFRSLFPESAIKAIDRFEVQFEQVAALSAKQSPEVDLSSINARIDALTQLINMPKPQSQPVIIMDQQGQVKKQITITRDEKGVITGAEMMPQTVQ